VIRTKDLVEFVNALVVHGTDHYSAPIDEYRAEIVARLRAYDKLITCPEMSETVDTKDFVNFMYFKLSQTPFGHTQEREYIHEIVARLKRYDKLKESIEKLCRRLSNGVDE